VLVTTLSKIYNYYAISLGVSLTQISTQIPLSAFLI
jgi:hypothetical protein